LIDVNLPLLVLESSFVPGEIHCEFGTSAVRAVSFETTNKTAGKQIKEGSDEVIK